MCLPCRVFLVLWLGGVDWWGVVNEGIDWWGEYDSFLNPRRYDPWWYDLR